MHKLQQFTISRQSNARYLSENIDVPGIIVPQASTEDVFHQYTIRITPEFGLSRDEVAARLSEQGVGSSVFYPLPIHKQKAYGSHNHHHFPVAEKLAGEVLSLPVHPSLSIDDLNKIVNSIRGIKG